VSGRPILPEWPQDRAYGAAEEPAGPRPIGYVEIQRSWQSLRVPPASALQNGLENALAEACRNSGRPMQLYSSRVEHVATTTNVYYGFVPIDSAPSGAPPRSTPQPLNPRNMNEADHPLGTASNDLAIGMKETRFGR
jgi:hypothetical protein